MHLYPEAACRRAFANAQAEFTEKAPRFSSRAQCDALFAGCSIAAPLAAEKTPKPGKVASTRPAAPDYMPRLGRIRIITHPNGQKLVLPTVAGAKVEPFFEGRPIDKDALEISADRARRAQSMFRAAQTAASRPPGEGVTSGLDGAPSLYDPGPQDGTAQTYPVAPDVWRRMQEQARKIGAEGGK